MRKETSMNDTNSAVGFWIVFIIFLTIIGIVTAIIRARSDDKSVGSYLGTGCTIFALSIVGILVLGTLIVIFQNTGISGLIVGILGILAFLVIFALFVLLLSGTGK